ncbi:hypothetical protein LCGC14_2828410 [marine sediment metagenome]|uniref:Uncharacterized protein n=1 Tax=marine sediment metagenome TaxID=412755 RepID=A0A0F9ANC6_9ZZZZ
MKKRTLKEIIYEVLFGIAEEDLTHAEKQILKLVKPKKESKKCQN